jgi:hypothetical protein
MSPNMMRRFYDPALEPFTLERKILTGWALGSRGDGFYGFCDHDHQAMCDEAYEVQRWMMARSGPRAGK